MWIVTTAGQQWEGAAEDHFDACVQAIKSLKFDTIGVLMSARPVGTPDDSDDGVMYCSGERACEAAGLLTGVLPQHGGDS